VAERGEDFRDGSMFRSAKQMFRAAKKSTPHGHVRVEIMDAYAKLDFLQSLLNRDRPTPESAAAGPVPAPPPAAASAPAPAPAPTPSPATAAAPGAPRTPPSTDDPPIPWGPEEERQALQFAELIKRFVFPAAREADRLLKKMEARAREVRKFCAWVKQCAHPVMLEAKLRWRLWSGEITPEEFHAAKEKLDAEHATPDATSPSTVEREEPAQEPEPAPMASPSSIERDEPAQAPESRPASSRCTARHRSFEDGATIHETPRSTRAVGVAEPNEASAVACAARDLDCGDEPAGPRPSPTVDRGDELGGEPAPTYRSPSNDLRGSEALTSRCVLHRE
jgi:hypothetical protein